MADRGTDTDADAAQPERSRYPSESFFKVYYIASPTIPEVVSQALNSGEIDDLEAENFWNYTIQEIIRHHRQTAKPGGLYHPELIMIIDRPDVFADGVLVLNLNYHGYVDAVRRGIGEAGNILGSLSILNTEWCEERIADSVKTDFVPWDWFALYNLLPETSSFSSFSFSSLFSFLFSSSSSSSSTTVSNAEKHKRDSSFNAALKLMNDGIFSPDLGSDDEEDEDPYILANPREYYRPIERVGQSLDQIIASHDQYAREHQLDPSMFAVVDNDPDWKEKGILIVKMSQDKNEKEIDSFRHKGYSAGEILPWIFIGFMSWEEAKKWDPAVTSS